MIFHFSFKSLTLDVLLILGSRNLRISGHFARGLGVSVGVGIYLFGDGVDLVADGLVDGAGLLSKDVGDGHEEVQRGDQRGAEVELGVVHKVDDVVQVDDDDEDEVAHRLREELVAEYVGCVRADEVEKVERNRDLERALGMTKK